MREDASSHILRKNVNATSPMGLVANAPATRMASLVSSPTHRVALETRQLKALLAGSEAYLVGVAKLVLIWFI